MCSATAVAGGFTAFSPLNRIGGSGGGSFGGVGSHSNGRMKVMWLGHKASSQHGRTGGTWWREENEIARYSHPKMFSPFHQTAWVTVSEPPVCLCKRHTSRRHSCKIDFASVLCVCSRLWGGGIQVTLLHFLYNLCQGTALEISPSWCHNLVFVLPSQCCLCQHSSSQTNQRRELKLSISPLKLWTNCAVFWHLFFFLKLSIVSMFFLTLCNFSFYQSTFVFCYWQV